MACRTCVEVREQLFGSVLPLWDLGIELKIQAYAASPFIYLLSHIAGLEKFSKQYSMGKSFVPQ